MRKISTSHSAIARRLASYRVVPEYVELERRHYGIKARWTHNYPDSGWNAHREQRVPIHA